MFMLCIFYQATLRNNLRVGLLPSTQKVDEFFDGSPISIENAEMMHFLPSRWSDADVGWHGALALLDAPSRVHDAVARRT